MSKALGLAQKINGSSYPSPPVGCVIVKEGKIIATGTTQPSGGNHAEAVALQKAASHAHGAVLYVTLEPCTHWGKHPPCTDKILSSGIKRVVFATEDITLPIRATTSLNPLEVTQGILEKKAQKLYAPFTHLHTTGRPQVTLKLASTIDGKIADYQGNSQWISTPASLTYVHELRQRHDCILIGTKTLKIDNPLLTCRLQKGKHYPLIRAALDATLALSLDCKLVKSASQTAPVYIFFHKAQASKQKALEARGVTPIPIDLEAGKLSLMEALQYLGGKGVSTLLCEGGGEVVASFIKADLVDTLIWVHNSSVLGAEGRNAVASLGLIALHERPQFSLKKVRRLSEKDYVSVYERHSSHV